MGGCFIYESGYSISNASSLSLSMTDSLGELLTLLFSFINVSILWEICDYFGTFWVISPN